MRPRSFSAGNTSWRTCPSFSLLICYLRIIVLVSVLASPIAEHVGMHAMRIVGNLVVVDPNEKLIAFDTFWSIKRLFLMRTKCSLVSTRVLPSRRIRFGTHSLFGF